MRQRSTVVQSGGIISSAQRSGARGQVALGARGVLLGRAWLQMAEKEMRVATVLTGVNRVANIDASVLM